MELFFLRKGKVEMGNPVQWHSSPALKGGDSCREYVE
jgi:hypothetical protein